MQKINKNSINFKNHRKLWMILGSTFAGIAGIITFTSFSETSCSSGKGELKYRILNQSNHTCEVSGTSDIFKVENLTIPSTTKIKGTTYTVTGIGSNAFWGHQDITGTLTLPTTLTELNESAFHGCCNISGKLILPGKLKLIGNDAFFGCEKLIGTINIPESVTEIGSSAFFQCRSISQLYLPSDITTVKSGAFYHCDALTHADLGHVSIIEPTAFEWCAKLESWTTAGTLTRVTAGAFRGCEKLNSISFGSWDTAAPFIGIQSFLDCGRTNGTVNGNNSTAFLAEAKTAGSLPNFWHN